jgi:phosphatidylserine/phosphatidylglycerophosphate/cardiolipin synthase-like enzyme
MRAASATLLVVVAVFLSRPAGANACGGPFQWSAQSATEQFSGTGSTFSFLPTGLGTFSVTVSDATEKVTLSPPITVVSSTTAVTLTTEPVDGGSPLVGAIAAAQTSVHLAAYLLSDASIISALTSRKLVGLDVKVLLESAPQGANNQSAHDTLANAGVSVNWAPTTFTFNHEEYAVVDGTRVWITTNDMTSASRGDRGYFALDSDSKDVAEAEALFEADFAHVSASPSGALAVAPNDARAYVLAMIGTATSTIDIETTAMSDTVLVNALVVARGAGVTVRVVLSSGTASTAQQQAESQLKTAGASLVALASPSVEANTVVVDGVRAYVGSAALTTGALGNNREVGVMVENSSVAQQIRITTSADFASGTPL